MASSRTIGRSLLAGRCPLGAPLRARQRLLLRRGLRYLRDQLFDEGIAEGTVVLRDHDERAGAADKRCCGSNLQVHPAG